MGDFLTGFYLFVNCVSPILTLKKMCSTVIMPTGVSVQCYVVLCSPFFGGS